MHDWITRPYLTDLQVDWGALPITDPIPEEPRDLFSGETLTLVGRYVGGGEGAVTVRGRLGGQYWEQTLQVVLPEAEAAHGALASIWARRRIEELLLPGEAGIRRDAQREVTRLALEHQLVSPFTSFVAVDYSVAANPAGSPPPVRQAVPPPEGVGAADSGTEPLAERVGVFATAAVANLTRTAESAVFHDAFIQDLPVPGRFYQNVLTLAPGVQDSDGDGTPNVHGSRSRDFKSEVGGVSDIDPLTGGWMSRVNPNSIEEMELITAGAGVEFGRAQGGFARVIQKQGSNTHEGSFDLWLRSDWLDAIGRDPGPAAAESHLGGLRTGSLFSGPLIRDRLWYRLAHEWTDLSEPFDTTAGLATIPTRGLSHADQLTWQVSPRNKLAFRFGDDSLDGGQPAGPRAGARGIDRGPAPRRADLLDRLDRPAFAAPAVRDHGGPDRDRA